MAPARALPEERSLRGSVGLRVLGAACLLAADLAARTAAAAPEEATPVPQEPPAAAPQAPGPEPATPQGENHRYRVAPAASPIKVDGVLDEAAWDRALRLDLKYEIQPGENTPAEVRTECLVTYDDRYLHVAFRAHDPRPEEIRVHLTDRDTAYTDDNVGFMIDPFNDERRGFQIFANALGAQMDSSRNDVGNADEQAEDPTWDAIWLSAGRMTGTGYVVEVAVPFTSLRFPRAGGEMTWGFLPLRSYPRSRRHQLSVVPLDRNRNCTLCQAAKLIGFAGVTPGRNLEFDPTLTSSRNDDRDELATAPLDHGGLSVAPGLSARWGITPNLSLNAAARPDFSQVEADVAQLDVNNRFVLFFPEKRPFFLEGADFFNTPFNVIYTRTVTDPAWGVKLTGKEGKNALGVAFGRDRKTSLIFPSNQESDDTTLNDLSNDVGVLRYRRDIGTSSTVGVMATSRAGEGYHNRLYGADAVLRLTNVDTLRLQALRSSTRYPDSVLDDPDLLSQPAGTLGDQALLLRYTHWSRDWFWQAAYEDLGKDFRADTGFIPRVDTRRAEGTFERVLQGAGKSWFDFMFFGPTVSRIEDHEGLLTDQEVDLHLFFAGGPGQSQMFARVAARTEYFDGTTYDLSYGSLNFGFRPTGDLELEMRTYLGDAIDYDNSRAGRILRVGPEATLAFGRGLHLSLDHTLERLDVLGGQRLYTANLTQVRLVQQFSLRTFARAIVQYEHISRDPALYLDPVDRVERNVLAQLLFSYKVNPQTLVFVGYSENRTTVDYTDLTLSDRTVFFKIGYAWLM
jgi:hypothetical protein